MRDFLETLMSLLLTLYEKTCNPNKYYFLDKTPRYYLIFALIARLISDAKFISLIRNPSEVTASFIETWGKGRLRSHPYYVDLYRGLNSWMKRIKT